MLTQYLAGVKCMRLETHNHLTVMIKKRWRLYFSPYLYDQPVCSLLFVLSSFGLPCLLYIVYQPEALWVGHKNQTPRAFYQFEFMEITLFLSQS